MVDDDVKYKVGYRTESVGNLRLRRSGRALPSARSEYVSFEPLQDVALIDV